MQDYCPLHNKRFKMQDWCSFNMFRIEHIDFFKIRGLKYKIGPLQNEKIQMQKRTIPSKTKK